MLKHWTLAWISRHAFALSMMILVLAGPSVLADPTVSVSAESVKVMSGLSKFDNEPMALFGPPDTVSDLLVRCWSRPSSDWSQFRTRFADSKCTSRHACAYLNLVRAWQVGRDALGEHIKVGDISTGFAIVAVFAREPDTRGRLLSLLPSDISKQALSASSILDWLWSALQSERFFDLLAAEYVLDQPFRGESGPILAYNPFLRAGRALSFVWRRDLEHAISRQTRLIETTGSGVGGVNCKVADALFKMTAIEPSVDVINSFTTLNVGACSGVPISRSFEMTKMVGCCIWDVGSVVLGGLREPNAPSFIGRDVVAGRLRETNEGSANVANSPRAAPPSEQDEPPTIQKN